MRVVKQKKGKGIVIAVSLLAAILLLVSGTFAWYISVQRKAESNELDVMKPYYLTLMKPNERDELELAIGNLYPGEIKQTVFCVSNAKTVSGNIIEMGGSNFDYTMELVYTENLALQYTIYELVSVATEAESDIVTEESGVKRYWKKLSPKLASENVSKKRWVQAGLATSEENAEAETKNIVNRGLYNSFTKDSSGNSLHLKAGTDTANYKPGYFVIEVKWNTVSGAKFEQYEKETDMIYILVKALQPEPKKKPTP